MVTQNPQDVLRSCKTFPEASQQSLGLILENSEGLYDISKEISQQKFVSILTCLCLSQQLVEARGKIPFELNC